MKNKRDWVIWVIIAIQVMTVVFWLPSIKLSVIHFTEQFMNSVNFWRNVLSIWR